MASSSRSEGLRVDACWECGKPLPVKELEWRKCQMCGRPICLEHAYYIRARRKGLYDSYYDSVRVCSRCKV